jgi:hypothetical protein
MVEAYGTLDQVMGYYGNTSAPGGHFPFNFRLITDVHYNPPTPSSAEDFSRIINEYLDRMTDGRTPNWVVRTFSVSRSVLSEDRPVGVTDEVTILTAIDRVVA